MRLPSCLIGTHSSVRRILAENGGIRPTPRPRSERALTLAEREEISLTIAVGPIDQRHGLASAAGTLDHRWPPQRARNRQARYVGCASVDPSDRRRGVAVIQSIIGAIS
jgi:hypothetical protein